MNRGAPHRSLFTNRRTYEHAVPTQTCESFDTLEMFVVNVRTLEIVNDKV